MSRETRNNLIFLALLLALMAPGAVILFKKKSQPGERPIGSPDPVRRTSAYMDPYPAESVERLAPLLTLQWVGAVALSQPPLPESARGRAVRVTRAVFAPSAGDARAGSVQSAVRLAPVGGSGNVGTSAPFKPIDLGPVEAQVISDGRWFQVASAGPDTDPARQVLRLIVWDEDADPARGRLDARTSAGPATVLATHRIPLPRHIRHNLQDAGFVSPPEFVLVLDLSVPADATDVTLLYEGRYRREQTASLPPIPPFPPADAAPTPPDGP